MKIKVFETSANETFKPEDGHRDGGYQTREFGPVLEKKINAWLAENPHTEILNWRVAVIGGENCLGIVLTIMYDDSLPSRSRRAIECFYNFGMHNFSHPQVDAINSARRNGQSQISHEERPIAGECAGKAVAERILEWYRAILDRFNFSVDDKDKVIPGITHARDNCYLVTLKTVAFLNRDRD